MRRKCTTVTKHFRSQGNGLLAFFLHDFCLLFSTLFVSLAFLSFIFIFIILLSNALKAKCQTVKLAERFAGASFKTLTASYNVET